MAPCAEPVMSLCFTCKQGESMCMFVRNELPLQDCVRVLSHIFMCSWYSKYDPISIQMTKMQQGVDTGCSSPPWRRCRKFLENAVMSLRVWTRLAFYYPSCSQVLDDVGVLFIAQLWADHCSFFQTLYRPCLGPSLWSYRDVQNPCCFLETFCPFYVVQLGQEISPGLA